MSNLHQRFFFSLSVALTFSCCLDWSAAKAEESSFDTMYKAALHEKESENPEQEARMLEEAIKVGQPTEQAKCHLLLGDLYQQSSEYQKAIAQYQQAIANLPAEQSKARDLVSALLGTAHCYRDLRQQDERLK